MEVRITRIILYTGKGGVGKTSIAAATALKSAEKGLKTLVVSTDAADKALDRLPSGIQPAVRGLQTLALTSLRDSLDQYLKNDRSSKESTLKKIDLE